MLFNTSKMIPDVYGRERDMRALTLLLDIVLTSFKHDVDNLGCIYDANYCPEAFLPFLAKTFNYEYNDLDTVTSNRKIIDIFTTLEKHRGSDIGLRMATALSLTALDMSQTNLELANVNTDYITALTDVEIQYCYDSSDNDDGYENTIIIDYPNTYTLVRYLLDYVRPVGMYIYLRSIEKFKSVNAMAILAQVDAQSIEYMVKQRSGVGKAVVNFSSPVDDDYIVNKELQYKSMYESAETPDEKSSIYSDYVSNYGENESLYGNESDWFTYISNKESNWEFVKYNVDGNYFVANMNE